MPRGRKSKNLVLGPHKNSIKLYKFIKMVVGKDTPDRTVAIKWKMDVKNFHQIKTGKAQVPKIPRLLDLARVLQVNPYLLFAVGAGEAPAKVYRALTRNDRNAQISMLVGRKGR